MQQIEMGRGWGAGVAGVAGVGEGAEYGNKKKTTTGIRIKGSAIKLKIQGVHIELHAGEYPSW